MGPSFSFLRDSGSLNREAGTKVGENAVDLLIAMNSRAVKGGAQVFRFREVLDERPKGL
jgi:hypothetical protein